jgi:hypothetical protein
VIDNNLITKPFSSKDRVACRWVNMKLNCNAEISIGDFRAVTANHHCQLALAENFGKKKTPAREATDL